MKRVTLLTAADIICNNIIEFQCLTCDVARSQWIKVFEELGHTNPLDLGDVSQLVFNILC